MIIGLGNDLCNIRRIEKVYNKFGNRFINKCYSQDEQNELAYLKPNNKRYVASLAKRFAAKEAVVKAMGTGFSKGVCWNEIELLHHNTGQPKINLLGQSKKTLQSIVLEYKIWVTLSDDYPWTQAVVIIETN